MNVKPTVDIWSFGGVCSEAAVWVVLGMPGLNDYRRRRQQEICERGTSQDGCCFHDGEKVLQTVERMHDLLLTGGVIRPGDHVTKPVLLQMVPVMLEEDPDARHYAINLWKRSAKILTAAANELKSSNQQTNPRESMGSGVQKNDPIMPVTPPHTNAQAHHENAPHAHGPPPYRSRHSSNLRISGLPSSFQPRLDRRSDTWHAPNANPNMASSPLDGGPSASIANPWPLGAIPPIHPYSAHQERSELYGTTSDNPIIAEAPSAVRSLPYSSSNGLRNEHQNFRQFPPPENNIDARSHVEKQSLPGPFRSNDNLEPELGIDPQNSNLVSASMGYDYFPTATDTTSGKSSRRSSPNVSTVPPMADTPLAPAPVKPPAQTAKPEKPYLSYKRAKEIRLERGALQPEHQALLNDLKHRDHVSP